MDRGNVDVLNVLGLALLESGETTEAATQLERARALAPERADLANNLGKALFAAGRLEEAVEVFEAALALDGSSQTARENLEVARRSLTGDGAPPARATTEEPRPSPEDRRAAPPASEPGAPARLGATFADVRHAGTGRDAIEVTAVEAGGLAERAGLRAGDLILRVAGQGVGAVGFENAATIARRLSEVRSGDSIRLDLFRGQEALAVTIRR
jgi:tetratricopeptide (TPR) repeat protein